ncbi:MAG TPA: L,D-transpeptidase [Xanthobacteraceae bacterium]|nr:L,D-transpeptidase [Xanthobacteraceae bacterium]
MCRLLRLRPSVCSKFSRHNLPAGFAVLFGFLLVSSVAQANILISVDKSRQQMSVSVDGMPRYRWTVSTGRDGFGTPNGTYHPTRMERKWFSKEYYDSPMPHSIFFHGGYAIHGSYEISRLGGPASHGCVRLHPADAAKLFALVKEEGMANTTIVVSGQAPVVARRRVRPSPNQEQADFGGAMAASPYGYYEPDYPAQSRNTYYAPRYEYAPRYDYPPRGGFQFFRW